MQFSYLGAYLLFHIINGRPYIGPACERGIINSLPR